jgi:hypothetical protein
LDIASHLRVKIAITRYIGMASETISVAIRVQTISI